MAQYAQGVMLIDPDTGLPYRAEGGEGGGAAETVAVGVRASDDIIIPVDSLPQVMSYTGDRLDYVEVDYLGNTYRQTLTYTGTALTGVSQWELQ